MCSSIGCVGNFLVTVLGRYFENVSLCPGLDVRLVDAVKQLRGRLESRFDWTFDGIDDGPLVV